MKEKYYLLTEEELRNFRNIAYQNGINGLMPIDALNNYPEPIHVPDDAEIESQGRENNKLWSWSKGMKDMKNLILKGKQ